MPKAAPAPPRKTVTITYKTGNTETYDVSAPALLYQVNRFGVKDDEIDASFFLFWLAAEKPMLNGELTVEMARPLMEAWLNGVAEVDIGEVDQSGPPTKRRAASPGSAA